MARRNRGRRAPASDFTLIGLSERADAGEAREVEEMSQLKTPLSRSKVFGVIGGISIVLLLGLGVMAKNGWLPHTDGMTGKKTGLFGRELPKNAASSWNPFAAPPPSATPQLSKEYIYAGSRLLAVEDANANAVPPADIAVWRPDDDGQGHSTWYVLATQSSPQMIIPYGLATDKPLSGDFDGDGKTDLAIWRPSSNAFNIQHSSDNSISIVNWGISGDVPALADYDGDGKTDVAIWRDSSHVFAVLRSSDNTAWTVSVATSGAAPTDKPASADYDGDGKADFSIWRDGASPTFNSLLSGSSYSAQTVVTFPTGTSPAGCPTNANCIVSADYDGDGKANYAIKNGGGAGWVIMNSALTATSTTTPSGDAATDFPVQNDYDGDGKVDIAVWHPTGGIWYIRKSGSSGALRQESWGLSTDIPVPAYLRR